MLNDHLKYGDRVRINHYEGRVISREPQGRDVTVEMFDAGGRSKGATTLTGYDQVFRRRLDSFEPGSTPTYSKWLGGPIR